MPNFYLFEPSGEREVKGGDFVDTDLWPMRATNMEANFCKGRVARVMVLKKFDHDPHAKIKEAYEDLKEFMNGPTRKSIVNMKMWKAIEATVRELEAK